MLYRVISMKGVFSVTNSSVFFGRRMILTDYDTITAANVVEVLTKALTVHNQNRYEIDYLYQYYKGNQPVLNRVKKIRSEINNKIVVNRADEIVSFKTGYLVGEPLQYVNSSDGENAAVSQSIERLNKFMSISDKAEEDMELAEWFYTCGVAYRMVLPNAEYDGNDSPFNLYTLDPRFAFVVRHSGLGNRVMMGVKFVITEEHGVIFSVYTRDTYFEIVDGRIVKAQWHMLGGVPIVEYIANKKRQGAFEIVISMLDAINEVASNRLDGIEQFIQALMVFKNVDVESEDFDAIKEKGGIKVPENGDVTYLIQELNQQETQTLVNDMYQTVLILCGMPNRNGGSSTSDTGLAVVYRDGWSDAEARAKKTELSFKKSEKQTLKLILRIASTMSDLNLRLWDIGIRFTRRNYENTQGKAQVLTTMLANDKIHPRLAFEHCGMFVDPELAYSISEKYAAEQEAKLEKELAAPTEPGDGDV